MLSHVAAGLGAALGACFCFIPNVIGGCLQSECCRRQGGDYEEQQESATETAVVADLEVDLDEDEDQIRGIIPSDDDEDNGTPVISFPGRR